MPKLHKKLPPALLALSLEELRDLDTRIHERITELENFEPPEKPGREVIERQASNQGDTSSVKKSAVAKRGANVPGENSTVPTGMPTRK